MFESCSASNQFYLSNGIVLCCVVVGCVVVCRSGQLSVQEAVTVLNQARDNGNVLSTTSLDFLMIEVGVQQSIV
jgi:hypothetical protein